MARPTKVEQRQKEAKAIFESETFVELLSERRQQIIGDWEVAETVEAREGFHAQLKALNDLKDFMYGQAKERRK